MTKKTTEDTTEKPRWRKWVKIYIEQSLRGTMMEEFPDPAERFVWFGFLLLAGDSPFEGKIAVTPTMGYSDEQLASMLKCEPRLITSAKAKMVRYEKIIVLDNNVIRIVNWKVYQSDWDRKKALRKIKAYRDRRTPSKTPTKSPSKTLL